MIRVCMLNLIGENLGSGYWIKGDENMTEKNLFGQDKSNECKTL